MKSKLAVFFGGRSVEHDVSIVTGLQAIENADKRVYDTMPVYIARDGLWYTGPALLDVGIYKDFDPSRNGIQAISLSIKPGQGFIAKAEKAGRFGSKSVEEQSIHIDAALLCNHGMHGEDGCLQGMLEMCDIPYTSAGVVGSAVGIDKAIMKRVFAGCGFPQVPFVDYTRKVWQRDEKHAIAQVEDRIGYPAYVKPSNLGSSIGISRVDDRSGLKDAVELAFMYDRKVVIEKAVSDPMEINCSVIGADGIARASVCERPLGWEEFLTFEDKYLKPGSSKGEGKNASGREIPANIDPAMTEKIQKLAVDVFNALDCKGVVRIDFLVDKTDNALYVNEINTIPGSLAFYLWEPSGLRYEDMIEEITNIAIHSMEEKKKNEYAFDSTLLEKVKEQGGASGAKGGSKGKV